MVVERLVQCHKTNKYICLLDAIFFSKINPEPPIVQLPSKFLNTEIQVLAIYKCIVVFLRTHASILSKNRARWKAGRISITRLSIRRHFSLLASVSPRLRSSATYLGLVPWFRELLNLVKQFRSTPLGPPPLKLGGTSRGHFSTKLDK